MPFGNITAQTFVYEPRKPGTYQRAGLALGAPINEFRLSGASGSKTSTRLSVSVTRIMHKDFIPAGAVLPIRVEALVTVNIQMPNNGSFSAAEGDSLVADINEFITAANLARLSAGEI